MSADSGNANGVVTHKSVSWKLDDTFHVNQKTSNFGADATVTYVLTGFGKNGGEATIVITGEDGETRELTVTSENEDKKEFTVKASDKSFTVKATDILSINPKEYQNQDYDMSSQTGEISGQILSNKSDAPTSFEITNKSKYEYSVRQVFTKGGKEFTPDSTDEITYSLSGLVPEEMQGTDRT
jgi:hypothetical protein